MFIQFLLQEDGSQEKIFGRARRQTLSALDLALEPKANSLAGPEPS